MRVRLDTSCLLSQPLVLAGLALFLQKSTISPKKKHHFTYAWFCCCDRLPPSLIPESALLARPCVVKCYTFRRSYFPMSLQGPLIWILVSIFTACFCSNLIASLNQLIFFIFFFFVIQQQANNPQFVFVLAGGCKQKKLKKKLICCRWSKVLSEQGTLKAANLIIFKIPKKWGGETKGLNRCCYPFVGATW